MRNAVYLRVLIIVWIFFAFSLKAEAGSVPKEKQIIVIFRYDDYSSVSSTDIEAKLINTLQKHGISCIFGVIPYTCAVNQEDTHTQDIIPLTKAKADILKKAIKKGVLEVALHGYSHQTIRPENPHGYTEFLGLDYNIQMERIAKGKKYLEELLETPVTTFIPPWNSYDSNTVLILEKQGFKTISAGLDGYVDKSSVLKFVPTTSFIHQLRNEIELARRIPEARPIIIALIHPYYFLEVDSRRGRFRHQDFEELIDWVTSQKDVRVLSLDQTIKMVDDLSAGRLISYSYCFKMSLLIPPLLSEKLFPTDPSSLKGIYLTQDTIYNMKIRLLVFILLLYFAILAASIAIAFFGGLVLFPRLRLAMPICKHGIPTVLILISICTFLDLTVGYKGATAMAVLSGAYIGILRCIHILKKTLTKIPNTKKQKLKLHFFSFFRDAFHFNRENDPNQIGKPHRD